MCECCGLNPAEVGVSAMLSAGASERTVRVTVCGTCKEKAQRRDQETWMRIKAVVQQRADL